MIVIRSFDINKPGSSIEDLKGGVAGGSIIKGVLKVGDEIEIRPGKIIKSTEGSKTICEPIFTRIISLEAEKNKLLYAIPGGLVGVGTLMDPSLTKANELVGNIIGYPGQLPDVYDEVEIEYFLLRRLVGVKTEKGSEHDNKISKLMAGEVLNINIGSTSCGGKVLTTNQKLSTATIALLKPVCTEMHEKVAISRRIMNNWRLIGWGKI